jgi:hypothetical protein
MVEYNYRHHVLCTRGGIVYVKNAMRLYFKDSFKGHLLN